MRAPIFTDEDIYKAIAPPCRPSSDPVVPLGGELKTHLKNLERTLDNLATDIAKKCRGQNRDQQITKLYKNVLDAAQEMMLEKNYYFSQLGLHVAFWAAAKNVCIGPVRDVYEAFCEQTNEMLEKAYPVEDLSLKKSEHQKSTELNGEDLASDKEYKLHIDVAETIFTSISSVSPTSKAGRIFYSNAVDTLVELAFYEIEAYQDLINNQIAACLDPTNFPGAYKILKRSFDIVNSAMRDNLRAWIDEGEKKAAFDLAHSMVFLSANVVVNYHQTFAIAAQARQTFEYTIEIAHSLDPERTEKLLNAISEINREALEICPDHKGINDLLGMINWSRTLSAPPPTLSNHDFASAPQIVGKPLALH